MKRWEADYVLEELDKLHLFDEYIEMSELKRQIQVISTLSRYVSILIISYFQ